MSLVDSNGTNMYMPVAPAYNGGSGMGYAGDGLFWIIILFLFAAMNGNGWGVGNGNSGALPFMMAQSGQSEVQRVVDQQSLMSGISALSAAQANGFANAEISRCNAQQNLMTQLNGIAMTQQNCCCENRAAVADLKYTMAQEAAATRANTDAKVQNVMDKLCQLEMDGIKQNYENRIATMQQNYENRISGMQNTIDDFRNKSNVSSVVGPILADNAAQTAALENYLNPPARPAYVVQNPNCCAPMWNNCGCGAA